VYATPVPDHHDILEGERDLGKEDLQISHPDLTEYGDNAGGLVSHGSDQELVPVGRQAFNSKPSVGIRRDSLLPADHDHIGAFEGRSPDTVDRARQHWSRALLGSSIPRHEAERREQREARWEDGETRPRHRDLRSIGAIAKVPE
jgi:hypothetical protein